MGLDEINHPDLRSRPLPTGVLTTISSISLENFNIEVNKDIYQQGAFLEIYLAPDTSFARR